MERRFEAGEIAVAGGDVIDHRAVAVAGLEAFAHQQAEIAGQGGVAVVDRLVLADEAAQILADLAGSRLEGGVAQHLVGQHGAGGRRPHGGGQRQQKEGEKPRVGQ